MSEKPYRESYLEVALEEILEIEFYLEMQREGLGEVFRSELNKVVDLLLAFPESGLVVSLKGIRRSLLSRFPYAVLYVPTDETLLILAVAHTSRAPSYWEGRF